MAAALIFAGASAAAQIMGGFSAFGMGNEQKKLYERQARQVFKEALQEADRVATEVRKFRAQQSVNFGKSGVTLEGSPLLVLEETRREGEKEVKSIREAGRANMDSLLQQGQMAASRGRSALLSSFLSAGASMAQPYIKPKV